MELREATPRVMVERCQIEADVYKVGMNVEMYPSRAIWLYLTCSCSDSINFDAYMLACM